MEREVNLCTEVEPLREFVYIGESVNIGGRSESVFLLEKNLGGLCLKCGYLLYGKGFPLTLKLFFARTV